MAEFSIESLGFTKEELEQRLIDRIADQMLNELRHDPDGDEWYVTSPFAKKLNEAVKARIDEGIAVIAEKYIFPNAETYIENVTLQATNQWGEKKGDPVTFKEYMAKRAEEYLTEKVSYEGKSRDEANGFSWSGTQTRITYMVGKHLHYSIESTMKEALKNANSAIAKGIQETVKLKLEEVAASLKVGVTTK